MAEAMGTTVDITRTGVTMVNITDIAITGNTAEEPAPKTSN